MPINFWNDAHTRKVCIEYLVNDILNVKDIETEAHKIQFGTMQKYGMQALLSMYGGNRYAILKEVYPSLREWQLIGTKGYWDVRENRERAIKDICGESLDGLTYKDIALIKEKFKRYRISGLIQGHYGSLTRAFEEVYGIQSWEIKALLGTGMMLITLKKPLNGLLM